MTMRTLPLVIMLASGCALFGISKKDKGSAEPTQAQLDKLREIGGEQAVADLKLVDSLDREAKTGEYQLEQCFSHYLYGHKHLREGKDTAAQGNFRTCASMCEAAAKRDGGKYADFTSRYIEDCGARESRLAGATHLARAEKKIDEFRHADGMLNWYYRDMEVRGAFTQAAEALGDDDPELAKLQAAYDEAKSGREDGLQLAKDFMARDDVRALNRRRDDLRAQISGLEKDAKYSETARVLLEQRKRDLREADAEFSALWDAAKG